VTYYIFYPFIKFDEGKSFGFFFVSCAVIRISYGGACLYSGTITSVGAESDISHYTLHKLAFVAALATQCDYPYWPASRNKAIQSFRYHCIEFWSLQGMWF